jgi:hypothetical protein
MPNKTKTIAKLKIPNKYFPDFLRGHIDGDGCIRTFQDAVYPNSQRLYTHFISGSQLHIIWLRRRIFSLLHIKGHLCQHARGTFELGYGKKESKVLLNAMYYNKYLPCLKRKRKIAEKFLF